MDCLSLSSHTQIGPSFWPSLNLGFMKQVFSSTEVGKSAMFYLSDFLLLNVMK